MVITIFSLLFDYYIQYIHIMKEIKENVDILTILGVTEPS